MTMFRYFSGNEGWSYHFAARIVNVAQLGGADFHEAHRVAEKIKVGDGESWYREWQAAGDPRKKDSYLRCVKNFHAALLYFDNPRSA